MIIFLTTNGHQRAVEGLVDGSVAPELPEIRAMSYDELFSARHVVDATYVFADIERLSAWEQELAAASFRALRAGGVKCLNDPARVMTRFELLKTLHRAGINPFTAYRADDDPRPARFPVFIRREAGHIEPADELIGSQSALDAALDWAVQGGLPRKGLLVVEFCGEPIRPGVWRKFGTYCIGGSYHADHVVVENQWVVKHGSLDVIKEDLVRDEHQLVVENRVPEAVRIAFDLGSIEFGRADHGTVDGREVIYEINTNPRIAAPAPLAHWPLRDRTMALGRVRMAALLRGIDGGDGRKIGFEAGEEQARFRRRNPHASSPMRP